MRERLSSLSVFYSLADKRHLLEELDARIGGEGFWDDPDSAQKVLKERSRLKEILEDWQEIENELEEAEILAQLSIEEEDEGAAVEAGKKIEAIEKRIEELETRRMLGGEDDGKGAIVSINAGAGGTEAQDWAEMVLRMYLRYCEREGFQVEMVDLQPGEEAGIKSATFIVRGEYAYGYLKGESGVHRLVRISPFDANRRRHTSFCSVFVSPEIEDTVEVKIDEKELKIDTFRAGGAGGQHVNKTDSAVRITHLPTGIVVSCQNERSQHQNRATAMKILRARLYELEKERQREKLEELHSTKKDIAWGNQIRSYVLHPYRMIKDHRTGFETGNVEPVLDGALGEFIRSYLLHAGAEEKNERAVAR